MEAAGPDAGVPAHYGNPVQEQRALERGRAVTDLSHRCVVTVTGPDRLSWLSTLSSQQLTDLKPGDCSELLLLDISGRIEQAPAITDDGETAWLITEPSHGAALADWLDSMKFMLRVEITDRTEQYAVLGSTRPLPEDLPAVAPARWSDPWPAVAPGGESYAAVTESEHPGQDFSWHLTLLEREKYGDAVAHLEAQGWTLAGVHAAEALRIAAWRPRLATEVDAKAIPHELDLIRTAVHLSKGCYKGQETVARVHNLGHPPRRLVFLHLDGSEHTLPTPGSEVLAPKEGADPEALATERAVGVVTSVARHHEAGPIALALVKRKVDPQAQLVVRDSSAEADTNEAAPQFYAAAQEVIVRPDAGQSVGRPQGDFLRGRPR
ncbi:CAF17-like 4Fe-4S cluster assembly/insertion protein YgfZ [Nesterenkonia alkaliphila]|uniref:CAF17-like 4Fe-4S cluster assembly/insertion protein YgfZ n=1 Tax=Nesterenkonia alkaliphila TaxID=1463631 RepID=UPI001999B5F5|nr:folate-binding protein [Nesterenkonia alkaliphila]GFZ78576.1 folate-binding protein [Nesterenkonia alkaliphila]